MNIDILLKVSSTLTDTNFTYDSWAVVKNISIPSYELHLLDLNDVEKGCLAFYLIKDCYYPAIPKFNNVEAVVELAASILNIDEITAEFLFFRGNHISFKFDATEYSSDLAECQAKVKFLVENYGKKCYGLVSKT